MGRHGGQEAILNWCLLFSARGRGDNGHEFSNMGYGECHGEFTYWIFKDLHIIAWGIHLNMGNIYNGEFTYSSINMFNLQIANRVSDHGYTGYLRAVGKTNQRPTGLIQALSTVATRRKIGHCFQVFNGHFRDLNWRYLPYIRPM